MFNKMDTDKDGIVTIEELKAGLRDFGTQLAESEVQMLIEAVHILFPSTSPHAFIFSIDCLTASRVKLFWHDSAFILSLLFL